ncbi:pantoate--beta-alanine ligase PanC [Psychroflexus torquis ATCC 700755]|uniref:Pantothenate synthetase n=1 Tax=Psychroflexus torquis (strain ATCC 700755 / CIP 106069 / ACAM 623) TaxID=313595 RepID=K4IDE4_PSYTT|nr:pantoate--beta-alanine ligase [Psychroflexus torquis]AFU68429.1 pantoate--beta-alanine ligase PanC [Psychroflexus torquis ATCC 700755]
MVIKSKESLHKTLEIHKNKEKTIGLVPTMGALHDGHLALIDFAYKFCDVVVVSIFVNPTQFNNSSDLEKYPRHVEKDAAFLKKHNFKTLVFTPNVEEVYADGLKSESYNFGSIVDHMEGEFRAGHFDGVGSVLKRLFAIVSPDKAFFGEKDYQQLIAVKTLVNITGQKVEIIGCPTNRNEFGLAQSSRNFRLSDTQLKEGELIFEALSQAKSMFDDYSILDIEREVNKKFQQSTLKLEYFSIVKTKDLIPTTTKEPKEAYRGFIAAFLGDVRLIDNMALN